MGVNTRNRIITDGLILNLDAGNRQSYTSGSTTWRDLSGNGFDCTLINGPTFDSGGGGSIYFNGVNNYGRLPVSPFWGFPQSSTVNVWCNPLTSSNIVVYQKGSWVGWIIGFGIVYSNQIGSNDLSAGNGATTNVWQQITFVIDRVAGQYRVYRNGILLNVNTINHTPITAFNDHLYLGARGAVPDQFGNVYISSLQIYTKALTDIEVMNNFNAYRTRYGL